MAIDKAIDSTQLDTDLTSVANAIRTKGGTSAQLAFPAGFVSAIDAIPTGGTFTGDDLYDMWQSTDKLVITRTFQVSGGYLFSSFKTKTLCLMEATGSNGQYGAQNSFRGMANLETLVIPQMTRICRDMLLSCAKLETVDCGNVTDFDATTFSGCSVLNTLIIRRSTAVPSLNNTSAFNSTPFASGGAGGTIYIPKALYDHLGDGGSYDYKAKTNWSTVNGYGTITWAKIEGSYYETHYADGTLIS